MVAALRSVWAGIDWQDSMWSPRTAWERFASRVRSASSAHDVGTFISHLSRKCGVQVPLVDPDVVDMLNEADESECMRQVRINAPLLVALLRAEKAVEKAAKAKPYAGLFGGSLTDDDE